MKKSSVLLIAAAMVLSSCGLTANYASKDDGQRFQDGIYGSAPSFRTRTEKAASKSETEALVNKTKESQIYLFGDKKDTIAIPENMSARIQYDQKIGGTVVTLGENPYDWRYDLENNYGYYYGPYSIGSSWYWSRHYSPYWSSWGYSPWRYHGWHDPFYVGGWYDPWYYGGYYDPWYGGYWGYYDPWYYGYGWYPYHHHHHYCGWYGGWDPHHGPGHIDGGHGHKKDKWYGLRGKAGSERIFTSRVSSSGGTGTRSGLSRVASSSPSKTAAVSRATSGTSSVRRTSSVRSSAVMASSSGKAVARRSNAVAATSKSGTTSVSRPVSSTSRNTASRVTNYRRPSGTATTGTSQTRSSSSTGYSRQSSPSYNSGSYSRSSSDSYSRSSSSSYSRSSSSSYNSSSSYSRSSSGSYGGGSSSGGGYSRSSSGGGSRR